MRYVADRFGPAWPGLEPALQRAIVDLPPSGDPVTELETLLGVTVPELIVDWAGMLYADGRLTPAEAPDLQMTSWDLLQEIPAGPRRLDPPVDGFADFSRVGGFVGGGTAYHRIDSGIAHGPLAISVDDGTGNPIHEMMQPYLWILRMR